MWLTLIFITVVVLCFSFIVYSRIHERYTMLSNIGEEDEIGEEQLHRIRKVEEEDTGLKHKYVDGDYSHTKQRVSRGQLGNDT